MRIKVLYKAGIENSYKANGYDKAYFVEVESEDSFYGKKEAVPLCDLMNIIHIPIIGLH